MQEVKKEKIKLAKISPEKEERPRVAKALAVAQGREKTACPSVVPQSGTKVGANNFQ